MSAASLDQGVNDVFEDKKHEVNYGVVRLQPLLFQDDVAKVSGDVFAAQAGNLKMEQVLESKLLDFNLDKSVFLVIGTAKQKSKIHERLKETPLKMCNNLMKQTTKYAYLGEVLSEDGNSVSVLETIKKRQSNVYHLIFEIKSIIEDCRSNVVGGFITAMEIWEMAVIPALLNSADCWTNVPSKGMEILNRLQESFFRCLFKTGRGCPIPIMYWETASLTMTNRIILKKLLFIHHLENLEKESLAFEIYQEQKRLMLPGLVSEANIMMADLEIEPSLLINSSKAMWKKMIKSKIREKNRKDLLSRIKNYKKLNYSEMKDEPFEVKQYLKTMTLTDARTMFSIKSQMTKTVQYHFRRDKGYTASMWSCVSCQKIDSINHIKVCPKYDHLRLGKDLNDDKDLVHYVQEVVAARNAVPVDD